MAGRPLTTAERQHLEALERKLDQPRELRNVDLVAEAIEHRQAPGGRVQGDGAVRPPGALPVSRSLPRRKPAEGRSANHFGHQVLEHRDGTVTNLVGQPIIASHADADRQMKRHGYDRDDAPPTAPDSRQE